MAHPPLHNEPVSMKFNLFKWKQRMTIQPCKQTPNATAAINMKINIQPVRPAQDNECWICLCPDDKVSKRNGSVELTEQLCACPRKVHRSCLARWQYASKGEKRNFCTFCSQELPPLKIASKSTRYSQHLILALTFSTSTCF